VCAFGIVSSQESVRWKMEAIKARLGIHPEEAEELEGPSTIGNLSRRHPRHQHIKSRSLDAAFNTDCDFG
jgi:hypothetical protein